MPDDLFRNGSDDEDWPDLVSDFDDVDDANSEPPWSDDSDSEIEM